MADWKISKHKQCKKMAAKQRNNKLGLTLKVTDVFCFICRSVLIKPVTLPCNHVFCELCFECAVPETSYTCPLCRRRVSNWVRTQKKCDTLINNKLWKQIQIEYGNEVRLKLAGKEDGLDQRVEEHTPNIMVLSPPGEVGAEYSKLIQTHEEAIRQAREKEEKESKELIDRILQEEADAEQKFKEEAILRLRNSKEKMRTWAQKKAAPKVVPSTSRPSSSKTAHKPVIGPMDQHIKRSSLAKSANKPLRLIADQLIEGRSTSSDSGDSISSELNHFKPIRAMPKTPPKHGIATEQTVRKITPIKLFVDNTNRNLTVRTANSQTIHSSFSAFRGRVKAETDDVCDTPKKKPKVDDGVLKEINLDENSDSNSRPETDSKEELRVPKFGMGEENLSGLEELFDRDEQKRLEERILQEKADRELALKLSREWDEPRPSRLPRSCRQGARQLTLIDAVANRRKK